MVLLCLLCTVCHYTINLQCTGYANDQLAPKFNGFHHFFGFYQGAIDYITKVYNDIEEGALPIYDFFEDEEACYDVIDTEENTMDLYSSKIREYLDTEGQKVQSAKRKDEIASPFFLMATLQSMHAPFPVIRDYADECKERIAISADTLSEEYQEWRQLYCELTLITDRVVGEIVDGLKSNDLYENTLIIFTADNGGDTDNGASNYPFRGTKGEFYEGNTRVITSISGGIIESAGLAGTVRDELFSNLDWTPTLLQFAGYLSCIDPRDYTWDGRNQYDLIMNTPDYDSLTERTSLILNIGDVRLKSARIILDHEGKRYKYLKSDNESALDRWIYSGRLSDVWTIPDYEYTTELAGGMSLPALKVIEYDENDQDLMFSQHYHDAFLFDLSEDPSELYNLLHPKLGHFDEDLNTEIVSKCEQLLAQWMDDNVDELFSPPMDFLHKRLRDEGDPKKLGDGKFVRSFLSDHQYKDYITTMFEEEHNYIPQKLQDLYLTPWVVPERMLKAQSLSEAFSSSNIGNSISELQMSVLIPVAVALGVIMVALCFVGIYFCRRKKIAEDSFEESMIREAILIQNGLSEGTRNYKYQSVNRQVL